MSSGKDGSARGLRQIKAVCFDYRGVILDHRDNKSTLPGMKSLLSDLRHRGIVLALASRFPLDILIDWLGPLQSFFGDRIYSAGSEGKLGCLRRFAKEQGMGDLSQIAFIDDKPDNLLPVAEQSPIYVIGFKGSGKYADASAFCRRQKIPFAEDATRLRAMLLERIP